MPWTDFWLKVPFLKTSSRETAFFCADTVRALQINNAKVNRNNRLITYHFLAAKYTENMEKGKASLRQWENFCEEHYMGSSRAAGNRIADGSAPIEPKL